MVPHNIDDILDELEAVGVTTIISINEDLMEPIINAGRIGREDIKRGANRVPFNSEYQARKFKYNRNRRPTEHTTDFICEACGYSNHDLHRMLKDVYTGNPE